jgi:hypothetical protein
VAGWLAGCLVCDRHQAQESFPLHLPPPACALWHGKRCAGPTPAACLCACVAPTAEVCLCACVAPTAAHRLPPATRSCATQSMRFGGLGQGYVVVARMALNHCGVGLLSHAAVSSAARCWHRMLSAGSCPPALGHLVPVALCLRQAAACFALGLRDCQPVTSGPCTGASLCAGVCESVCACACLQLTV